MSRTLFIGDVHGCADELEELCERINPTQIYLVGDLFTKGPQPKRVWKLIQKHHMQSVLGNHDIVARKSPKRLGLSLEAKQWLYGLPLRIDGGNWSLVHAGIHPYGGISTRSMTALMRHWTDGRLWFEHYSGERLIIYGHDARRGLQDHRPKTLGLDTGCVYGGKLTGYVLESDEIVQVKARRIYQAI